MVFVDENTTPCNLKLALVRLKKTFHKHFLEEHREGLKKPGMKASDVAKAAGAEWNKLNDKTVRKYTKSLFVH